MQQQPVERGDHDHGGRPGGARGRGVRGGEVPRELLADPPQGGRDLGSHLRVPDRGGEQLHGKPSTRSVRELPDQVVQHAHHLAGPAGRQQPFRGAAQDDVDGVRAGGVA